MAFMEGRSSGVEGVWDDDASGAGSEDENEEDEGDDDAAAKRGKRKEQDRRRSRHGKWESGKGRCAVTGRRVLGGTDGLRRVMV